MTESQIRAVALLVSAIMCSGKVVSPRDVIERSKPFEDHLRSGS